MVWMATITYSVNNSGITIINVVNGEKPKVMFQTLLPPSISVPVWPSCTSAFKSIVSVPPVLLGSLMSEIKLTFKLWNFCGQFHWKWVRFYSRTYPGYMQKQNQVFSDTKNRDMGRKMIVNICILKMFHRPRILVQNALYVYVASLHQSPFKMGFLPPPPEPWRSNMISPCKGTNSAPLFKDTVGGVGGEKSNPFFLGRHRILQSVLLQSQAFAISP